jgi:hypothetical protein
VRKISYSTFTIVDIDGAGNTRIIEYDNPPYILVRDGREQPVVKTPITLKSWQDRTLHYSRFQAQLGDRIVFFSDGISQAGMGEHRTPLGWGRDNARDFALRAVARDPDISAHELARKMVIRAQQLDGGAARDDITCGVIYLRQPRRLLVATGPPYSTTRDAELARIVGTFKGRKAICGGTTANIVSRILGREVQMDLGEYDPEIPPAASMDGVDLITEGTLTLGRVASLLESGTDAEQLKPNAATSLLKMLLSSDIVHFVVGTRINQAHQDPNIPVELELRRNIVKKIAGLLETRYIRETHTQYL